MDTFDEAIKQLALEVADLVVGKQKDYGKDNILKHKAGPELGIVYRIDDKLNRAHNLLTTGKDPKNESLDDTWRDVIGYGLCGLLVRRGQFELPLKK